MKGARQDHCIGQNTYLEGSKGACESSQAVPNVLILAFSRNDVDAFKNVHDIVDAPSFHAYERDEKARAHTKQQSKRPSFVAATSKEMCALFDPA